MTMQIEAIYEFGILRPVTPLNLPEGERVSVTVKTVADTFARHRARAEREHREIEIINRNLDALSEEALDVLDYQVSL